MPAPILNMSTFNTTDRVPPIDPYRAHMEALEVAGKMVEKVMNLDNSFPLLKDRMRITAQSGPTVSGLSELDYPNASALSGLSSVNQLRTLNKVPLPPEIMEHFGHMQNRCMMGVFPDINRAWLTIDKDIYIWDFEHGTDVAYYDGLSETIVSVGLVKPKPGVFQNYIRNLLVLTTTLEIIVLGVSVTSAEGSARPLTEIHLTPESIYNLPTDGVPISVISGTATGRIFLGGQDGSLFELQYQKEIGWNGKRYKKLNHSTGALSFLVPTFLNAAFMEDDSLVQISVDNSRHILYTLSERGTISVFDLGDIGQSTSRLASLSQSAILQAALSIARTLESSHFQRVVSVSAVTAEESTHVGLVAVTAAGSRLYFTTGPGPRPTTLQLIHVRLPPGFAANPPTNRPANVHMALYTHGVLVMVTGSGTNQDKVWCLSGDVLPMQRCLSETFGTVRLDGVAWALQEMYRGEPPTHATLPLPPLVVREHYEPAKKFVVLTPSGAEIMMSLRPVDVLSQLLQQSLGPESELVKAYFSSQSEDQACATCLMLATDQSAQNTQISEWATRAFFLYGGEPRLTSQVLSPSSFQYSLPPGFNPGSVSTPVGMGGRAVYSPDNCAIQFSAKHNGLYLFLSRILRPLWNSRIVQKVTINGKQFLVSSVSGKEVTVVSSRLCALRSFLQKNTQSTYNATSQNYSMSQMDTTPVVGGARRLQEVQLQEKQSLDSLVGLVDHCCQVLGLWRILCEHQFHVITDALPPEQQTKMSLAAFRDLIIDGQDICMTLITKMINIYLNDNSSIDPISIKLRNVCPKLYRNEDAACTKANEMINVAKTKQNREERERLLGSALKLCKEVAPQINLAGICRQLVACQYYTGVVELTLECATKCDPKDLALHYYMSGQQADGTMGYQAYMQRLDCYKEVRTVLDHLRHKSNTTSYSLPTRPGSPPPQPNPAPGFADDNCTVEDVIKLCVESGDKLLHVEVYEWLALHRMYGELISLAKPSLELYLNKATSNPARRDAAEFADLLWKYHERHGNHSAAAQILYSLAKTPGTNLNLEQRITYLAKAVLCMRSDQVGCAPHLGVFLHELEDYLQVANVQKKVLDDLANIASIHGQADDAIKKLNSCLLTITELYEEFAEPYKLYECKLAIIDVSGHDDLDLIQGIWDNIIEDELRRGADMATEDRVGLVLAKVKQLGSQYLISSRCFPVAYLMWQLEQMCCREDANRDNVFNTFFSTGISFPQLVDIYKKMYIMNDRCWASHGNEFYLIEVIACLAEMLINNPKLVKSSEKQSIAVSLQDLITSCLSTLYSRPDTDELVTHLNNAHARLSKI